MSNNLFLYGMVWYGMVWYGMVWYGMVWYGMVLHCIISPRQSISLIIDGCIILFILLSVACVCTYSGFLTFCIHLQCTRIYGSRFMFVRFFTLLFIYDFLDIYVNYPTDNKLIEYYIQVLILGVFILLVRTEICCSRALIYNDITVLTIVEKVHLLIVLKPYQCMDTVLRKKSIGM